MGFVTCDLMGDDGAARLPVVNLVPVMFVAATLTCGDADTRCS